MKAICGFKGDDGEFYGTEEEAKLADVLHLADTHLRQRKTRSEKYWWIKEVLEMCLKSTIIRRSIYEYVKEIEKDNASEDEIERKQKAHKAKMDLITNQIEKKMKNGQRHNALSLGVTEEVHIPEAADIKVIKEHSLAPIRAVQQATPAGQDPTPPTQAYPQDNCGCPRWLCYVIGALCFLNVLGTTFSLAGNANVEDKLNKIEVVIEDIIVGQNDPNQNN